MRVTGKKTCARWKIGVEDNDAGEMLRTRLNYSYAQLLSVCLFTAQSSCYGTVGSTLSRKLTNVIIAPPETVGRP